VPLHIGIVACSAEGAALCYRTICLEGAELLGPHAHPEISMHGHNFADYVKCINANDWVGVAELMLSSAEKLSKTGADFLIAPVNTVHQAFDLVEHRSPRPWLHIAVEVANEAKRHGYKRLGVLGTRALKDDGCDAVVLGCTEIPLLMTTEQSPLPMLDSTRLLARAALGKAVEG
jgi:aspartate racemase